MWCSEKPKNYYELLEIPARGVSSAELKKAFRRASIKYHPDKNLDADTTDLFIEVTAANNIISNEQMRFAYDVYAQTNFDQEESIRKGLQYSKKSEEEQERLFWHIINNKRMFQSALEIFPYYFAWMMAVVLLVNVSSLFVSIKSRVCLVCSDPTASLVSPARWRWSEPLSSGPKFTTATPASNH